MNETTDWLSRLLEFAPVRGRLDLRCVFGAPWRIEQPHADSGEMPYHVVLAGSATLEDPENGSSIRLKAGDILVFPKGASHVLHDGSGASPAPTREREAASIVVSENTGAGARLDMLCGHFVVTAAHERLLRNHLPERLIGRSSGADEETSRQLKGLATLMRAITDTETLGAHAMLDALSTALFTVALRLASESRDPSPGLLSLAGSPRLAPALEAIFRDPARAWTLPELAQLCTMSRATFVRLFREKLGASASDLLTDIRMTMAANELRKPSAHVAAVAGIVGYQSEAAFQRAFKKHMGVTPTHWRKLSGHHGHGEDPAT
ncbi:AraC family transcriptional regulator [Luteibacter yeojuensis]|uniref:AraC family transcriptional regulator n=1 Tax=Luteibacter yeojuensis TaxID=345309 RepID=UPI0030840EF5